MVEKTAMSRHPLLVKTESTWDTDFGNHASLVLLIMELLVSQVSCTQIHISFFIVNNAERKPVLLGIHVVVVHSCMHTF